MRKPKENPRTTVAIIGSGMAGLVTGYLLKQDQSQQFDVQVFEMVRLMLISTIHDSPNPSISTPS